MHYMLQIGQLKHLVYVGINYSKSVVAFEKKKKKLT